MPAEGKTVRLTPPCEIDKHDVKLWLNTAYPSWTWLVQERNGRFNVTGRQSSGLLPSYQPRETDGWLAFEAVQRWALADLGPPSGKPLPVLLDTQLQAQLQALLERVAVLEQEISDLKYREELRLQDWLNQPPGER